MHKIRMMMLFGVLVTLGVVAKPSLVITAPANGATVSPLTPMQRALSVMTEAQLDELLDQETVNRMAPMTTYPAGIELKWKNSSADAGSYQVVLATDEQLTANVRKKSTSETSLVLHNLEIGQTYYFRVVALDAAGNAIQLTDVQSFVVNNRAPRVMYIPGVPNVRDLGGRVGLEGRMIPQGMIFRSAAFNVNSPDGGKTVGKTRMDATNLAIEREAMKIRTEIDLRWDPELADMNASPLGEQVQYCRIPSTLYGGLFTPEGYANYRKLFAVFTKRENYPVDFHCILGADRTGSLAAVLLATLGVSREEIVRDYCFTNLYDGYLRPPRNIRTVLEGLAACGVAGDTLSDQAMRYLLRCGIRSTEIYDFLTIMLGEGLAMPEVLREAKVKEELQDNFTHPVTGLAVERCVMLEKSMIQDGKSVSWSLPVWHDTPLVESGYDGHGAFFLLLRNVSPSATTVQFRPDPAVLTAPEYFVLEPVKRFAYCAPDGGMRWAAAALADFRLALAPQEELLLLVQPAVSMPEGYQAIAWKEPEFYPVFSEARTAEKPPVIDGMLDDEAWESVAPYLMTDVFGATVEHAPKVWLATDGAHGILYLAAQLYDKTPCGESHDKRDASLWTEDSIEIFLASHGEPKTYQIILSAQNCVWDGVDGVGTAWNDAQLESKALRTAEGWAIEAAIPLAQFGFEGALELNVCANDNPGDQHFNLFVTRGAFHDRRTVVPVLLK